MAQTAQPTNGFDRSQLESFINRVEGLEEEIASTMGTAMRECKVLRGDIKDVYAEAKDKGIPMKALKAEVKLKRLDREKAKVIAGLDQEDEQSLDAIQDALGDFASSPLGEAVLKAARDRASVN
jgi:uncharacterized protein (UPF0335 family)